MRRLYPLSVAVAMCSFSLPSAASDAGTSPAAASAYSTECGSCHLPFPPELLARGDWLRLMENLSRHFGEDAAVAEETKRMIGDHLARNAGDPRRMSVRGDDTRLTSTVWFRRTHGYAKSAFAGPGVGAASNCGACHPDAAKAEFNRRDARIPPVPTR